MTYEIQVTNEEGDIILEIQVDESGMKTDTILAINQAIVQDQDPDGILD